MLRFGCRAIGLVLGCAALSLGVISPWTAGASSPSSGQLDRRSRDWLRVVLLDSVNEAELLIRNQSADAADLAKIEREQSRVRLYERIPRSESLEALAGELRTLAATLDLQDVRLERRKPVPALAAARVPAAHLSSERQYELSGDQLVQEIPITLRVSGSARNVLAWREAWGRKLLRWIEPIGEPRPVGGGVHELQARTFCFKSVEFPRIRLKSARLLLPDWARRDLPAFAHREPELWSLVLRSDELSPRAQPLTETRRRFRLESARLRYLYARLGRSGIKDAS